MNLTIEQMKAIVDGAPEGRNYYFPNTGLYSTARPFQSDYGNTLALTDLRAAIAEHDAATPTKVVDQADELAAFIRRIDGNHQMGAAELAERILGWLEQKDNGHD